MPTPWTEYSPTSASAFTAYSPTATSEFKQLEPPPGFGQDMFGGQGVEKGLLIHSRGFGSPLTRWNNV